MDRRRIVAGALALSQRQSSDDGFASEEQRERTRKADEEIQTPRNTKEEKHSLRIERKDTVVFITTHAHAHIFSSIEGGSASCSPASCAYVVRAHKDVLCVFE